MNATESRPETSSVSKGAARPRRRILLLFAVLAMLLAAYFATASYRREAARIALGIGLLEHSFAAFSKAPTSREAAPYKAWLLVNKTFAASGQSRGIEDWRLFQLAFVLAHIPTLASRMAEYNRSPWFDPAFDEETATLLYFPTGGGKSEAFFGLLVFNLFLDRLRGKNTGKMIVRV